VVAFLWLSLTLVGSEVVPYLVLARSGQNTLRAALITQLQGNGLWRLSVLWSESKEKRVRTRFELRKRTLVLCLIGLSIPSPQT
jgi:hypothetical protein